MNKIGIIVSRVSSGAEILFSSEAAKQWQNEALDTRNYLKCIDIKKISEDKFDSTFFDFVTFGKDVAFICTNKYISGRDSDLISAMIVVPGFVDINGKKLADILRETKDILQETKRDDQKLEQICSIDYGPKLVQNHSVPSIDPNSEGQYAYRYYGSGTPFSLPEILGSIFQNYYCNYKAVLLIDAESGISPKEGLKNLTDSDLKNFCILEYPKSVSSDITMKVNGELFTQSLLFDEGQQITLDISKKGCWPIQKEIIFDQSVKTINLANLEWEVKVNLRWFKVYDKADPDTQIPSSSVKITINDKEVDRDRDRYNRFNIHELTSAIIVVDVMGFEEARFKLNLLEAKQLPILLPLKKLPEKYNYLISEGCKVPNETISFSFEATHYNENKSPLAGYKIDHFSNSKNAYILVKKGYGWKKLTIGLVVFLFACIGIMSSCAWLYHRIFQKERSTKTESEILCERTDVVDQEEHSDNPERNDEAILQKNIEYLQTHTKWNITEMENISNDLKDLYNDVNHKKFSKIKSTWKEMLSNAGDSNYKLLQLAESKSEDGQGQYSTDGTITIDDYINKCSNQGGNANQGRNDNQGGNANQGRNGNQGGNANQGRNDNQGGNVNQGRNGSQGGNANQGRNGNQGGNASQGIGGLKGE